MSSTSTLPPAPESGERQTGPETAAVPIVAESASPPIATEPVSPEAVALKLKALFPALFTGPAKPLKLRIQADIQERAPGVFTKPALSAFLRRYTGGHGYLLAITKATHRFDLDGAPAAEILPEHRQAAIDELARRRGNQQARVELEAQQRRNRATLLADFERTTLTPANFCALKGVAVDELDGLLEIARREAAERPPTMPVHAQREHPRERPGDHRRPGGPPAGPRRR